MLALGAAGGFREAGFEVLPVERHAVFGRMQLVARIGDTWRGVADPDWEGTAAGARCTRE